MRCNKCGKDTDPPEGVPSLGLSIGVKYSSQTILSSTNIAAFNGYAKRQYGKYKPVCIVICCECVLDMLKGGNYGT